MLLFSMLLGDKMGSRKGTTFWKYNFWENAVFEGGVVQLKYNTMYRR